MQSVRPLPCHLAVMFMADVERGQAPDLELIELLSQMALGRDTELASQATASLYRRIILPLCDDFTSQGVDIANEVLITLIQAVSRSRDGAETRQLLEQHGLNHRQHFRDRYQELLQPAALDADQGADIKKAFVLSRVTLGADIAITSLIIQRLQQVLPQAALYLVGPHHLAQLFTGPNLHYIHLPFDRDGALQDKIGVWPTLHRLISRETEGLRPEEILLLDPDSRLSQLGLLPLTHTSATRYLSSRSDQQNNSSLAAITNGWLDRIFPDSTPAIPTFAIDPHLTTVAQRFCDQQPSTTFTVVINFGVGNDDNKRLAAPFEEELLAALLTIPGCLVILDSGKGQAEESAARRLQATIAQQGHPTAELSADDLATTDITLARGLLRFSGQIDAVAGLIAASDLFIGYDSCCQHVATATTTPAIICFTGAANKRFIQRWQPSNHHGKTTTLIIEHPPLTSERRAALITTITQKATAIAQGR